MRLSSLARLWPHHAARAARGVMLFGRSIVVGESSFYIDDVRGAATFIGIGAYAHNGSFSVHMFNSTFGCVSSRSVFRVFSSHRASE